MSDPTNAGDIHVDSDPRSRSRSRSPTLSEIDVGIDANFLRFLRRNIIVP